MNNDLFKYICDAIEHRDGSCIHLFLALSHVLRRPVQYPYSIHKSNVYHGRLSIDYNPYRYDTTYKYKSFRTVVLGY